MEKTLMLLDTCVLIDHLRGFEPAAEFIENTTKNSLKISQITVLELYQGARNKAELDVIEKLVSQFSIIPLSAKIGEKAIQLLLDYSLNFGLELPDALIASSCICNDLTLLTLNIKDFKFIKNLNLHKPY